MNNLLQYLDYNENGIFGQFTFDGDQDPFCVILTHAFADMGGNFKPITPPGTYICIRGEHKLSNLVPFETFEVTGVVGHTGILFHVGNYNSDSDGCFLVGDAVLGNTICDSRNTFNNFMKRLIGVDSFTLEVK